MSDFKCQVGVIGEKSTRDGRRQTRMIRGTEERLQIYTISHHTESADPRLDLTLNYDVSLLCSYRVERGSNHGVGNIFPYTRDVNRSSIRVNY